MRSLLFLWFSVAFLHCRHSLGGLITLVGSRVVCLVTFARNRRLLAFSKFALGFAKVSRGNLSQKPTLGVAQLAFPFVFLSLCLSLAWGW